MRFFANIVIKPYIIESGYRSLCEIGAKLGNNTEELLEIDSLVIQIIDPCLDADLCEAYRDNKRIQVHKGISLDVLKGYQVNSIPSLLMGTITGIPFTTS